MTSPTVFFLLSLGALTVSAGALILLVPSLVGGDRSTAPALAVALAVVVVLSGAGTRLWRPQGR